MKSQKPDLEIFKEKPQQQEVFLPENELQFSFSRSSGAGGQNINKLNTKATLRWNIHQTLAFKQGIKEGIIQRFLEKYPHYVLEDGTVIISSQKFRSQGRNIADCLEKLQEMLKAVLTPPKKRRPTKPTRSSVENRIKGKKVKAEIKKTRQKSVDY